MKHPLFNKTMRFGISLLAALFCAAAAHAAPLSEWRYSAILPIEKAGLVKFKLPVGVLNASQSDLADLRIVDGSSNEVPYAIQWPRSSVEGLREAKNFQSTLRGRTTELVFETGGSFEGFLLLTPAKEFIKAIKVEGFDGARSEIFHGGIPIFRQGDGAEQLYIATGRQTWPKVRITIDDSRSPAIPFLGVKLRGIETTTPNSESVPVQIKERNETARETRLTLDFGANHLHLQNLRVETTAPFFTRRIALIQREAMENEVKDRVLAEGTIYRVAMEGQPSSSNLDIPINTTIPDRELILRIDNGDSPPLEIASVSAEYLPVYVVFIANSPGRFSLLTGKQNAARPHYDLQALSVSISRTPVTQVHVEDLLPNPEFRSVETLAEVPLLGAPLDAAPWSYRRRVRMNETGVQRLELDLDVLAHSQREFADLRLLNGERQVPFLIDRASFQRSVPVDVVPVTDPKNPRISRWKLKLPLTNLPISGLRFNVRTKLFRRNVVVYEELRDDRGETYRSTLGQGTWTQTPDKAPEKFFIPLSSSPSTDTIILETDNGDNPAIDLAGGEFIYPATRLLFKKTSEGSTFLYYGNPNAAAPRYDLGLVASQILSAEHTEATMDREEKLTTGSHKPAFLEEKTTVIFWGILATVVIGLLFLVSRLLPKGPQ